MYLKVELPVIEMSRVLHMDTDCSMADAHTQCIKIHTYLRVHLPQYPACPCIVVIPLALFLCR